MNSQCSPTEEERHTRTLKNRQCKTVFWVAALATALLALPAAAADGPAQLPDPDNKAPDTRKPIKVFILSGQSNMCGMGSIAKSLDPLVKKKGMFQHLVDDDGNWTTRNDVFYMYNLGKATKTKACALSVHVNGRNVGPELQFGHIMGHIHGEVVLVIKACCGNRCLAYDVLPPSRREGRFSNEKWPLGCEYDNWFIKYTKGILKDLSRVYPDYKGQGYEIAGFGWWQGHKDGLKPEWTKEYEENLVAFIKDLRKDFNASGVCRERCVRGLPRFLQRRRGPLRQQRRNVYAGWGCDGQGHGFASTEGWPNPGDRRASLDECAGA